MNRNAPVAVLGSTPEFRDMLVEMNFKNIYIFEKYNSTYENMSNMRVYRNKEIVIEGDWLDTLPEYKQKFSFILSDLTSGNIKYDSRSLFYKNIGGSLAPNGLFIDKVLWHQRPLKNLQDLAQKYSSLPVNLYTINTFSCEFLFCSELLSIKEEVDTTLFYNTLIEKFRSNPRILLFIEQCPIVTPYDCHWYYGKNHKDVISDYLSGLKIMARHSEESYSPYYKYLKILISTKTNT